MTPAPEPKAVRLFVGVAVGTYDDYPPLPRSVADVENVRELLESLSYEGRVVPNPSLETLFGELEKALPRESLPKGGALILMWAGHGERPAGSSLHLIARNTSRDSAAVLTPEYLARLAARTGANQILLILDTCYSGVGALPALQVAEAVLAAVPPQERVWFGVVTSAQALERARDGVFAERLGKLLREGPSTPELKLRWSVHNAGVRGDDLIDALLKEWDTEQRPVFAQIGNAWMMLPNPRFDPQAPARVVEHLLLAARGIGPGEEGFYFTGRAAPLERIVAWLRADQPGITVVTGPAGCGKSAVVGRIVSLSNPAERALLLGHGPLEHADPGEASVHAHVHARGLTVEQVVRAIDEQLVRLGLLAPNPAGPRNRGDLLGDVQRSSGRPVIVIDGLDEAGHGAWQIADDVIRLLAPVSKVLIGTREVAAPDEGASLIQRLAPGELIDLGEEGLREATREDVHGYVAKRLASVGPPAMDPDEIAMAILQLASEEDEGVFLLARVVTAQLQAEPLDTAILGWQAQLARSLAAAFDRDLARIPPLRRGELEFPHAAGELLAALTWGKGAGFPDDLWALAAGALSPNATAYTRDDVYWLLGLVGQYVVEAGEGGRSAYRLSHQRLSEHLRARFGEPEGTAKEARAAALAQALVDHYLGLLAAGEPPTAPAYLWHHVWLHCAEGGPAGIQVLRRLVERDAATFRSDLALALDNLGVRYSQRGRRQEALVPTEEAFQIYRDLAAANPAFVPDLARALNNLGIRYSQLGRRAEALAPTEEAVRIHRDLAAANPAFLPDLARALNNLGVCYSQLGRRAEALAPTEEAVGIYRDLAAANPAFLPDLAMALNNLGNRYSELGRRAEALAPTQEAVGIYRDLAAANPAFLPDLARALNNLGDRYSELGRRAEALAPTEEAVGIDRDLAAANPAFLPDLASALNNLGIRYSELGRRTEALAPTEEAVAIYRDLAAANPAFLPDLASALNNLGIRYSELGRGTEALPPTEEAVTIYRDLAAANPAFLPDLASALNNLGIRYNELGRRAETLAPTEEAVAIYRDLAAANPAFLPDLARALNNLGVHYSELGCRAEALAPTEEAVRIRRGLAAANPAFLPDLANALNNLGNRYSELGRRGEALAPTEEGVAIFRGLAAANPAFLSNLAMALNNLGIRYSERGRRGEAIASTEEAVAIYRDLAAANPAFLPDLASALYNLSLRYRESGDPASGEEAWRITIEAFHDPAQRAFLRLRKAQAREPEDRRAVDDLLAALALTPETRTDLLADLHGTSRECRERSPSWFDAVWREATVDPLPAWLTLESEHFTLVQQWIETSPAAAAQLFLTEHAAELLSDATDLVLDEIALGLRDPAAIEPFRRLVAEAREVGIDEAYRLILAFELLATWMRADIPTKQSLLVERRAELLGDGAQSLAALQSQHPDDSALSVHATLLALARSSHDDLAFAGLADPSRFPALLADLARRDEIAALEALADLALSVDAPPTVQAAAWFHRAISLAVRSQAGPAVEALREARRLDSGQTADWLGLLVELSPKHPEVVSLSQALIAKTPEA